MQLKNIVTTLIPVFLLTASVGAVAIPVTFTFDGVVLSGSHGNGLGATGDDSAIATDMNNALQGAGFGSSTVSVSGALATATYSGEGHVNGDTLGTSNGGTHHTTPNDTFIINDDFGIYGSAADQFSFTFINFLVQSISFDWEIFPDNTCQAGSTCASHPLTNANYPDITLLVGTPGTSVWSMLASTPSSGDRDPQGLGTSVTINLSNPTNRLTFADWPAEVGIDNLVITGCIIRDPVCTDPKLPEPGTLYLLGACALAAFGVTRRGRHEASTARI